jgi:hypothetical protein
MSALLRGVLLAVVQVALIGAVGGKLLYDRASLPRAWVETAGVDPDLPIRGRYVALNLVLPLAPESVAPEVDVACGRIELPDGRPVAVLDRDADARGAGPGAGAACFRQRRLDPGEPWMLLEPVAFFLPEDAPDPTRDVRPGELWVEVTLPKRGAPRPIRLGLKRNGAIEPLR